MPQLPPIDDASLNDPSQLAAAKGDGMVQGVARQTNAVGREQLESSFVFSGSIY